MIYLPLGYDIRKFQFHIAYLGWHEYFFFALDMAVWFLLIYLFILFSISLVGDYIKKESLLEIEL